MNGAAPATCPKCSARVEWASSALGVAYLRDVATGAEHYQTCGRYATPWRPANAEPARMSDESSAHYALRRAIAAAPDVADIIAEPVAPIAEPDEAPDEAPEWTDADEYAERMAEVEEFEARRASRRDGAGLEWPELRREILRGGGIGPSPDWTPDAWPGDLYRRHGKAPDLVAVETMLGTSDTPPWGIADGRGAGDSEMRDYLQRAWDEWKRAQDARRPRPRKAPAVEPARALATPSPAPDALRSATLNLARLVADVADLVADGKAPAGMARQLADVARALAEAQA